MRAAGLVVGETLELLRRSVAPASPPLSSTGSPRTHPLRRRRARRSSATASRRSPRPSASRSTTRSCTASPAARVARGGRHRLDRLRRHRRRLARDAALTVPVGEVAHGGHRADAGHRGGDVARASPRPPSAGTSATSRTRWSGTSGPGRLRDRRGLHRARDRVGDAPAAQRAQPRQARPRAQARRGAGAGGRADGRRRASPGRTPTTTSGRCAPTTARWPRTSSTPSRSPPRAWVLTALDGGQARLAELGVRFGGR